MSHSRPGSGLQNLHFKLTEFVEWRDGVGQDRPEMKKKTLLSWVLVLTGISMTPVHGARRPPSKTPPPVVVTTTVDRPVISAL